MNIGLADRMDVYMKPSQYDRNGGKWTADQDANTKWTYLTMFTIGLGVLFWMWTHGYM